MKKLFTTLSVLGMLCLFLLPGVAKAERIFFDEKPVYTVSDDVKIRFEFAQDFNSDGVYPNFWVYFLNAEGDAIKASETGMLNINRVFVLKKVNENNTETDIKSFNAVSTLNTNEATSVHGYGEVGLLDPGHYKYYVTLSAEVPNPESEGAWMNKVIADNVTFEFDVVDDGIVRFKVVYGEPVVTANTITMPYEFVPLKEDAEYEGYSFKMGIDVQGKGITEYVNAQKGEVVCSGLDPDTQYNLWEKAYFYVDGKEYQTTTFNFTNHVRTAVAEGQLDRSKYNVAYEAYDKAMCTTNADGSVTVNFNYTFTKPEGDNHAAKLMFGAIAAGGDQSDKWTFANGAQDGGTVVARYEISGEEANGHGVFVFNNLNVGETPVWVKSMIVFDDESVKDGGDAGAWNIVRTETPVEPEKPVVSVATVASGYVPAADFKYDSNPDDTNSFVHNGEDVSDDELYWAELTPGTVTDKDNTSTKAFWNIDMYYWVERLSDGRLAATFTYHCEEGHVPTGLTPAIHMTNTTAGAEIEQDVVGAWTLRAPVVVARATDYSVYTEDPESAEVKALAEKNYTSWRIVTKEPYADDSVNFSFNMQFADGGSNKTNVIKVEDIPAGIEAVEEVADADAPVVYYNLQGVRMNAPVAGQVMIRVQGSNVSKILVK